MEVKKMKIKNFAEWKQRINEEFTHYRHVYPFLDNEGMRIYTTLSDISFMMDFCDNAREMLDTIDNNTDGRTHRHVKNSIYYNSLKLLAKREG